MNRIYLCLSIFITNPVFSQDIIVKKDGTTIRAKILEVNTSDVKFLKETNINGPTYTLLISDLLSINYENGDRDTFNNNNVNSSTTAKSQFFQPAPSSNNYNLISQHNKVPKFISLSPSSKAAKKSFPIYGHCGKVNYFYR